MDFTTAVSADQDDPNPENTLIETVSIVPAADYLITERRDLPDATIDGVCATAATGRCSLRAAQDEINAEVGPHRSIQLGDGNYVLTYDDGSQKRGLFFGGSVVLNGISPDRTSLYAGGGDEAIQGSFASIELRNLTIEGGEDRAPIFVDFSTLLLDNVVLKGNVTNFGVVNVLQTNTEIRNSTFVDNRVTDAGGLITVDGESLELVNVSIVGNDSAGPLVLQTSEFNPVTTSLNHVTISGNSAPSLLGVASGNLQLGNSILSDNSDAAVSDCSGSGSVTSLGGNVVGVDLGCFVPLAEDTVTDAPLLGPVSTWGPGHSGRMPLEGSPALDQALTATCVSPDQIGQTRPRDGDMSGTLECDSGALELLLDWLFGDGFE
jgi:hypothetical protein